MSIITLRNPLLLREILPGGGVWVSPYKITNWPASDGSVDWISEPSIHEDSEINAGQDSRQKSNRHQKNPLSKTQYSNVVTDIDLTPV